MKKLILVLFCTLSINLLDGGLRAESPSPSPVQVEQDAQSVEDSISNTEIEHITAEAEHTPAPAWTVIPFVLLLLMIATGPLFYEHFWHKNYPKIAMIFAAIVVSYYLFVLQNTHGPIHAL